MSNEERFVATPLDLIPLRLATRVEKGGPGSGHWGHRGRKGKRGGSAPSRAGAPAKLSAPITETAGLNGADDVGFWLNEQTKEVPDWFLNDYASEYGDPYEEYIEYTKGHYPPEGADEPWQIATSTERSELKAQVARDLAEASGVSEQEASDFVRQWAESSNDDDMRSLAIQQDAAKEFGLKTSEFTQSKIDSIEQRRVDMPPSIAADMPYDALMESDRQRAILRSMYNETQAELKARGITEVRLSRGVRLDTSPGEVGDIITVEANAIESWSIDKGVAGRFSRMGAPEKYGVVLEAVIPAERVLSVPSTGFGCLIEGEVTVLGGILGDMAKITNIKKPPTKGAEDLAYDIWAKYPKKSYKEVLAIAEKELAKQ